jgi:hypothetical protein
VKKSLAALFVAVLVLLPRAGLAQTTPPAETAGPLNIDAVPAEQRDQVWEAQAKKNDVNLNLLPPVLGLIISVSASSLLGSAAGIISLPLEYERAINRGFSVFGILQPSFAAISAGGQSASAFSFGIGAGARAYFSGNAPNGFWLGGEADVPVYPQPTGVSVRVESGYNFAFGNNLTFSLGGGLGLSYLSVTDPNTGIAVAGFFPAAGLRTCLGYAF